MAQWFEQDAIRHGGFEVELIDLAEVGLPFFDERAHPRLRRYEHRHTMEWSATVDRAVQMLKQVVTTLKMVRCSGREPAGIGGRWPGTFRGRHAICWRR